jgi:small-conductance mechanosensitive channel
MNDDWVRILAALAVVAAAAYIVAEIAGRFARGALTTILQRDQPVTFVSPVVRRPIRIIRATVFLAVLATLLLPALDLIGVTTAVGMNSATLTAWFFGSGLRIVVIALLAYVVLRIIAVASRRLEEELGREETPDMIERLKRARTLSRLIQNALTALIMVIAVLMMLRELQVDITPILTSAGILGLAVGFGAQTLVKDLIAGFFLTFENQVRVGDVATINGTGGLVEAINLRTIVLRDMTGAVHVFPNGSIERLSNLTKDFSYYVVDVGVAYNEDPDEVAEVLRQIGDELQADPRFAPNILEPLEILGVDAFEESQVTLKTRIKTVPLKQWEVGRELRRRIKKTFAAKGIEIPFRHVAVYFGEASKPFQVEQVGGPASPPGRA